MCEVLLSICIPTYNRADFLKRALHSITCQKVFFNTNLVEIVVSDNASEDNTKQVVFDFIEKYGERIRYFRNDINDQDKNFYDALRQAKGYYAKLCNDTLEFVPGSLDFILSIIKEEQKRRTPLFFTNRALSKNIYCKNMDDFIKHASYLITWIGGFGLWKGDLKSLNLMKESAYSRLPQTVAILSMIKDKPTIVVERKIFNYLRQSVSGNYNISEIFIVNYLNILQPYRKLYLSDAVYNQEKYNVLKKHVLKRQFNYKNDFYYDKSSFWRNTRMFHGEVRFYIILCVFFAKLFKFKVKKVILNLLIKFK